MFAKKEKKMRERSVIMRWSVLSSLIKNKTQTASQNEQVQYVYHCCLRLIFDQITMAQEQKYLR